MGGEGEGGGVPEPRGDAETLCEGGGEGEGGAQGVGVRLTPPRGEGLGATEPLAAWGDALGDALPPTPPAGEPEGVTVALSPLSVGRGEPLRLADAQGVGDGEPPSSLRVGAPPTEGDELGEGARAVALRAGEAVAGVEVGLPVVSGVPVPAVDTVPAAAEGEGAPLPLLAAEGEGAAERVAERGGDSEGETLPLGRAEPLPVCAPGGEREPPSAEGEAPDEGETAAGVAVAPRLRVAPPAPPLPLTLPLPLPLRERAGEPLALPLCTGELEVGGLREGAWVFESPAEGNATGEAVAAPGGEAVGAAVALPLPFAECEGGALPERAPLPLREFEAQPEGEALGEREPPPAVGVAPSSGGEGDAGGERLEEAQGDGEALPRALRDDEELPTGEGDGCTRVAVGAPRDGEACGESLGGAVALVEGRGDREGAPGDGEEAPEREGAPLPVGAGDSGAESEGEPVGDGERGGDGEGSALRVAGTALPLPPPPPPLLPLLATLGEAPAVDESEDHTETVGALPEAEADVEGATREALLLREGPPGVPLAPALPEPPPALCEAAGVVLCERGGEPLALGDAEPRPLTLREPLSLGDGVPLAEALADAEARPLRDLLDVAVTLSVDVGVGVPLRVPEGVPEGVLVGERVGVTVAESEPLLEGVRDADAPAESDAVGEGDTVDVPLPVGETVPD